MSLLTHALAAGVGYLLGQPERRRAVQARVTELAQRPEAQQLKERGQALAGQAAQTAKERAQTAKERLGNSGNAGDPATGGGTGGGRAAQNLRGLGKRLRPGGRQSEPEGAVVVVEEYTVADTTGTGPEGFGGRTLAEDSEAARLGTPPPTSKPSTSKPSTSKPPASKPSDPS